MGAAAEVGSNLLLFALVFGMSATVDIKDLKKQVGNKNALLTGVFLQFVVLPFLGFAVVKALNLSAAMGVTLLVVTSSPGGSYSNWWCSMFNADLALSVTMTAISTLLSIIMLPVNLTIYTTFSYSGDVVKNLDWISLFVSLVVVIGAIGSGLFCSAKVHSHKFNLFANKLGNVAGISLVVYSILVSGPDDDAGGSGGEGQGLWDRDWVFYCGVAAPCVLGLVIANLLTSFLNLAKPERVTTSVECCYQNVGIATSVAISMFEGDELSEAIGVPLFYGLVEAVVLGFYCISAWKVGWTKAPRDEKICVVIMTSYEVEDAIIHDVDAIEVVLGVPDDGRNSGNGLPSDLLFSFDEENGYHMDEGTLYMVSHLPGQDAVSLSVSGVKSGDEGSSKDVRSRDGAISPQMVLSLGSVDKEPGVVILVEEEEEEVASSTCHSPTSSDFSSPKREDGYQEVSASSPDGASVAELPPELPTILPDCPVKDGYVRVMPPYAGEQEEPHLILSDPAAYPPGEEEEEEEGADHDEGVPGAFSSDTFLENGKRQNDEKPRSGAVSPGQAVSSHPERIRRSASFETARTHASTPMCDRVPAEVEESEGTSAGRDGAMSPISFWTAAPFDDAKTHTSAPGSMEVPGKSGVAEDGNCARDRAMLTRSVAVQRAASFDNARSHASEPRARPHAAATITPPGSPKRIRRMSLISGTTGKSLTAGDMGKSLMVGSMNQQEDDVSEMDPCEQVPKPQKLKTSSDPSPSAEGGRAEHLASQERRRVRERAVQHGNGAQRGIRN